MSDIGKQYKALLEKLFAACKQYVQNYINELIEYGKKSKLNQMLCKEFARVHLDTMPNQFHIDVALFREWLLWLDKKFTHYYTVDEVDTVIDEAKTEIKEDVLEEIPPANFLSFTDYLTRYYAIGEQYTTRLLAIENGQPTSDINITNVVGCTILSRTYIGNGFDIVFTPTADEFSFTASLASDSSVNVVYSSTAEEIIEAEHLTYTDGSTAVVLHAMTLSSTPSVALRSGAGEATVTAIEFEELDTDDIIVIP